MEAAVKELCNSIEKFNKDSTKLAKIMAVLAAFQIGLIIAQIWLAFVMYKP